MYFIKAFSKELNEENKKKAKYLCLSVLTCSLGNKILPVVAFQKQNSNIRKQTRNVGAYFLGTFE